MTVDLFVDMQGAQTVGSKNRGIGRYSRELCRALADSQRTNQLFIGWNTRLASPLDQLDIPDGRRGASRLVSAPYGALPRAEFAFDLYDVQQDVNHELLKQSVSNCECRHVLFTSIMEADELNFVLPRNLNFRPNARSYSIVYDIIPFLFPENYISSKALYDRYCAHLSVKLSADTIFAISETTRRDLIKVLDIDPHRIVTIGAGIAPEQFRNTADAPDFIARNNLTKPFLLFLGGDEFRKNLMTLIDAIGELPASYRQAVQVLVTGRISRDVMAKIETRLLDIGAWEMFRFSTYLSHEDLVTAYRRCLASVIPSVYEGFGLPVLEAMACNAPVIASAGTSMAELLPDSNFLFDPRNPKDMAAKIQFILDHPEAVQELMKSYEGILSRHSWSGVAEKVLDTMVLMEREDVRASQMAEALSPSEPLAFALLRPPSAALVATIKSLSARHFVTIYCERPFEDAEALPVVIEPLSNLPLHDAKTSPVFCLTDPGQSLAPITRHLSLSNLIIVTETRPGNTLITDKNGRAYENWNLTGNRLDTTRWNESPSARPIQRDYEQHPDLSKAILTAVNIYRRSNPEAHARSLRSVLQKHGKLATLSRDVAREAAISLFETSELGKKVHTDTSAPKVKAIHQ